MGLATPSWLWLLLPWAALVVITLRAYRKRIAVPYLDLWPREEVSEGRRRAWRPPALPIVLLLAALLLAVVALSRPEMSSRTPTIKRITVVLDRGITMLAGDRLRQAAEAAMTALMPLLDTEAQITLIDPLEGEELLGPASLRSAMGRPATAVDLRARIARAAGPAPVLIISDQAQGAIENVGIVSASARGGECWLRLRNDSSLVRATVQFAADGKAFTTDIDLPARGEERNYVLRCPKEQPLRVELEVVDDLEDDNVWWIMPEVITPRISTGQGLPDWANRFAASYARAKPPGEFSKDVVMSAELVEGSPCVVIGVSEDQIELPPDAVILDHPVLANVVLPVRVRGGAALPAGEWQILVSASGRPLLAANDASRTLWIGFRPDGEITPDYLVLLSNAVEFCGGIVCETAKPAPLDGRWQAVKGPAKTSGAVPGMRAGLYRNGNSYLAVNAPAPRLKSRRQSDISVELLAVAQRSSRIALSPWLWVCAAALAASAAGAIRKGAA